LGLLEVGVHPNLGKRSHGHQTLAGEYLIARIYIPPCHDAVDLGYDIAIGKVQLGLAEVGLGLTQLRLGLLDVGGILENLFDDGIEIAVVGRIALIKVGEHLLRRLVESMKRAQLGRGLRQTVLRLFDRGIGLIQSRRNIAQLIAVGRLLWKAKRRAHPIDVLLRLLYLCLCHRKGFLVGFSPIVSSGLYQRGIGCPQRVDAGVQVGNCSLSSCTSRSPLWTRLLSSTSTRTT
jgi:hypothetical protein